jgi:hypothetical protein
MLAMGLGRAGSAVVTNFVALLLDAECVGIVPFDIAAADAEERVAVRDRHAVPERPRERSDALPVTVGLIEHEHAVIPDLLSAFPRLLVRKVRPTGDDQRAAGDTGERAGEAFAVGERGELRPLHFR